MERVQVLFVEVGRPPVLREIENSLAASQALVEGAIEGHVLTILGRIVRLETGPVLILCNADGRNEGLPFNRRVGDLNFYGNVFLVGVDREGDHVSIPDRDRDHIIAVMGDDPAPEGRPGVVRRD